MSDTCFAIVVDNTLSKQHVSYFFATCTDIPVTAWAQNDNIVLVENAGRMTYEQCVARTQTLQQQYSDFRLRLTNQ